MARRERDILEQAVRTIAEQTAKADDLVDEAKAAGGGDHPVTVHAKMLRLVDEIVGLRGLLGDGADGVLEDVALAACHCEMLARGTVDRWGKPRNGLP